MPLASVYDLLAIFVGAGRSGGSLAVAEVAVSAFLEEASKDCRVSGTLVSAAPSSPPPAAVGINGTCIGRVSGTRATPAARGIEAQGKVDEKWGKIL